MGQFTIKVGDRVPSLAAELLPIADDVSLVGATCVLNMRNEGGGELKVSAACTLTSTDDATTVQYDWLLADTDTAGRYLAEFVVTFADGREETFPSKGGFYVEVTPRV